MNFSRFAAAAVLTFAAFLISPEAYGETATVRSKKIARTATRKIRRTTGFAPYSVSTSATLTASQPRPGTSPIRPAVRPTPTKCKPDEIKLCQGGICHCERQTPYVPPTPTPTVKCKPDEIQLCQGGVCYCHRQTPYVPPTATPAVKCKPDELLICQGGVCYCHLTQPRPPECEEDEILTCFPPGSATCHCYRPAPGSATPVLPLPTVTPRPPQPTSTPTLTPTPPTTLSTCLDSVNGSKLYLDITQSFSSENLSCVHYDAPIFPGLSYDAIPIVGQWGHGLPSSVGFFVGQASHGGWILDENGDGAFDGIHLFGVSTDTPIVGDWNSDGRDDLGTVRGDQWFLDADGSRSWTPAYDVGINPFLGQCGVPLTGDLNGDGLTDLALFNKGTWYLRINQGGLRFANIQTAQFGQSGDFPAIGDLNGDGREELIVKRGSTWFGDSNSSFSWNAGDLTFPHFGEPIDVPLVGRWTSGSSSRASFGIYRSIFGLSGVARSTCR